MRREALEINDLLRQLDPADQQARKSAIKTHFVRDAVASGRDEHRLLRGDYRDSISQRLRQEK